ncbi:MAG TPA: Gfo/Idh/MocA family oxidoreductase [Tepidisphaeraceae bacterium]|nr:Gfo/Idh/MocA family oxidoreductase [Tepidisphaeraceae bacterium]
MPAPTRRDFLAGAATVLAAGLSAPTFADDAPAKPLGWAVVGIGKLSKGEILPAIAKCQKSKLVAIVTGHPVENKPIIDRFGIPASSVYNYDNYDSMASNPDIDCVYIVLPNGMHAEYTIRALKAGKNVLCEKPMANSSLECQQMIDASNATGKKLMVAYRIRREPYNMKAIELCQNGELGRPRLIVTGHGFHQNDPSVWRLNKKLAGGGALVDVGIYGLNATRYLTGEEPVSITAQQLDSPHDPRFTQVEEAITWTMKFPSGCMAANTTSYNVLSVNHQRVILEKGLIDMEPATGYGGIKMRVQRGHNSEEVQLTPVDQFQVMMDYFSDCVTNDTEPNTTGEEGLKDLRLIEAIYESARTGKTVEV